MFKSFFSLFFILITILVYTQPIFAQTKNWSELESDLGGSREYGCVYEHEGDQVATFRGLECLVANVLMVAITLIGLAGFVMIIIGSFRYLLSGSNSRGADTARNTLTFAIVGLILALSSYFIINIIAKFTGVNILTRFVIPQINQ